MSGTYTQYQLAKINEKETLISQWLNADGDPLRATDVVSCTQKETTKGTMPKTKSVLEMIRAGELECLTFRTPESKNPAIERGFVKVLLFFGN
ncbi:hypothetical protein K0G00_25930 [Klebsiella pneumoniae]|uniref:hypothetical protein n=1 Tax=Klebsiella pneumoniae TaxID=573 RepID=UPI00115B5C7C|nr:hypothetical protein [Klebsiella pneumoniae]MBS2932982.1 hypothetical protein [Klebsiella pneumoniae]MBW7062959.1 hypothetical protein [Klebsiella pneumoniae]MBW7065301.1 hypothetical protein [Klebsiella pneumoniae]MDW1242024.1 hypothetical protein [Klebsiella pneumoniae]MDZ1440223.1 hypothetical protein [Klebsiella pneumoniae]